jgi:hypothetical protein
MPLERNLIVFSRVAVELSRIEQWKISADHGFFSNAPLGAPERGSRKTPASALLAALKFGSRRSS